MVGLLLGSRLITQVLGFSISILIEVHFYMGMGVVFEEGIDKVGNCLHLLWVVVRPKDLEGQNQSK